MATCSTPGVLIFTGTHDLDVYNCSAPFVHGGQVFLYGNVEKRGGRHRNAHTSLFRQTACDTFALDSTVLSHQVENPHAIVANGEVVLGGTLVIKDMDDVLNCYTDVYRGVPQKVFYFTSGPDRCSHLRFAQLRGGAIAVLATMQSEPNAVRLAVTHSFDEIDETVINEATPLKDPNQYFASTQTLVVTQVLSLTPDHIGCICLNVDGKGHHTVVASVVELSSRRFIQCTRVADRDTFPLCAPAVGGAVGKLFPAGVVRDSTDQCQLYCGVDEAYQARVPLSYPFDTFGSLQHLPTLHTPQEADHAL